MYAINIFVAYLENIMRIILMLFLFLTVLISCKTDPNKQVDEGKIVKGIYNSEEIGWTMKIPKGWSITHKSVSDERTKRGLNTVNEVVGIDFDTSGLKHLLNFQKNSFNVFQSTSEPFKLEYKGEWEENNARLKELVYNTYLQKGIKADSTETRIVKIDGLDFYSYGFTIYSSNGDVILNQITYSRLINGFDFGVNINYNNDSNKQEMLDLWLNSKFKK